EEIIAQLQSLDLSTRPHDLIEDYIRQFGKYAVLRTNLPPGEVIVRARPHFLGETSFSKVTDLQYKPAHLCTKYQRASIPSKSMFYGSIIPLDSDVFPDINRVVAITETAEIVRNKSISEGHS